MTTPALPELPARVREALDHMYRTIGDWLHEPASRAALDLAIREALGEQKRQSDLVHFARYDARYETMKERAEKAEAALAEVSKDRDGLRAFKRANCEEIAMSDALAPFLNDLVDELRVPKGTLLPLPALVRFIRAISCWPRTGHGAEAALDPHYYDDDAIRRLLEDARSNIEATPRSLQMFRAALARELEIHKCNGFCRREAVQGET